MILAHPEAEDCQDEDVAGVVCEQVVCAQQALLECAPQEAALAAHSQQLPPPLLPLAAL